MKIGKNRILALSLALLITLPMVAMTLLKVNADENEQNVEVGPVEPVREGIWYKFETLLITLIFPAKGTKPMFLWWYTNDNSTIYVVKFKGIYEYLTFDLAYYDRRYHADSPTIQKWIKEKCIEPRLSGFGHQERERIRNMLMEKLLAWLIGLHSHFLPFSACTWEFTPPTLVSEENVSYWSFNFTLKNAPNLFEFAEDNIQIRCRFYNTTVTEIIDENHNYTVAAGQLKFDFVVSHWDWNIDKIKSFVDWLKEAHPNLNITIPSHQTGLALWINMASIKLEDITAAENEVQNQSQETVEMQSRMRAVSINDEYYTVNENRTQNEYERQISLTSRFRNRIRVQYANVEDNVSGFLEFVPWARFLSETGDTVDYVDVTASYIAAGAHLRLFICYPYFGDYTLEHDPTIGIASAPPIPTFIRPIMLAILIGATLVIAVAVTAVKMQKKPVNIVNVH